MATPYDHLTDRELSDAIDAAHLKTRLADPEITDWDRRELMPGMAECGIFLSVADFKAKCAGPVSQARSG